MTFNKIVNVKRNIHRFLPLLRDKISVFFEIYQRSKREFYFHCRGKSDFSEISIQTKNIFWFCSYTILALHIFAVSKCRFYFGVSNFKRGKSDEQIFGYRKCTTDKTECNTLCLQKKINVTTTEFLLRLHGTNVHSWSRQYAKKQYGQQVKTNTFSTKTDPGFVDFLAASTQKKKHKALVWKYKAFILKYVPCISKYMPYIFRFYILLKHSII